MIDILYVATPPRVATEVECAWAAGLFEGEGSFCWQWTDGRRYPKAYLGTSDPDVLRRFATIVVVGRIYPVRRGPEHWKAMEAWVTSGIENVKKVGEVIGGHLGERRSAKLAELLTWEPAERLRRNYCTEDVAASAAGYFAHRAHGEVPCERCRLSHNLYAKEWRSRGR